MVTYVGYVLMGLVAGFSSALLGIGGGVIIVPALVLFFSVGPKAATATSLAYIVPVALYGALAHWFSGHDIRWLVVVLAVPAGLLGAHLGLIAKQHLTESQLKVVFGVLMVIIGAKLVLSPWTDQRPVRPAGPDRPAVEAPR